MDERFARTRMLLGAEAMEKLSRSRVAVFGLGGVGGYAAEALARSGVGALDLIDNDKVALSNLNRQIIATGETLGMWKTDAARARIQSIHPACEVRTYRTFYLPGETEEFDFSRFDCVVDAIEQRMPKLEDVWLQHSAILDLSGLTALPKLRKVYVLGEQEEEVRAALADRPEVEVIVIEN